MTERECLRAGAGILAAGVLGALALPALVPRSSEVPRDACLAACLKTLVSAQLDFRENDRDRNGTKDFWRGDIAGLCAITPKAEGAAPARAITLIDPSLALADERPLGEGANALGPRGPRRGYWFRAIRHAGEKEPDPNRFAACAFPADYPRRGRWTFIVDERNAIYKRDLGRPGGVDAFPDDAALEKEWSRLD